MTIAAQQLAARVVAARRLGINTRRRRVPNARPPTLIESDYAGRLVAIVDRWREVFRWALPNLIGDLRLDEDTTPRARAALEAAQAAIEDGINVTQLEGIADDMAMRVSTHQKADLQRQSRAALGVDVMVLDPRVPDIARGFVRENVALIKKLKNATLDDLENIVVRAYASGTRAEAVSAEIAKRFDISERRARLIARDQIGRLTGQIAGARHQEIGLTRYRWRSMRDTKVRDSHRARDGRVYTYTGKEAAPSRPGQEILCRCLEEPVFDDVYAELDALGV
jgi:SPP1 gp7 family putative phage head morphogenesis protein